MSVEQQASSFGDPKAQPPTPRQTPTSAIFPSPVFETPKEAQGRFDDSNSWTPRFAEEYSVFNSTPGNLRGTPGPFVDFHLATPYLSSLGHKRVLSAEEIATGIATHATHFSPDPNRPLPPVDPSKRLPSSSDPQSYVKTGLPNDITNKQVSQDRLVKKVRRGTLEQAKGQTATPPPSAHKGARKLVPRLQTDTMQNEGSFSQEFVAGTPRQPPMQPFVTTPNDMFSYPMSAPATAPVFTDSRPFWDTDANMGGMDLDFSMAGQTMFPNNGHHRPMNSEDWGRTNQIFQETGVAPLTNQENVQPARRERQLAPKPMTSSADLSSSQAMSFDTSFQPGAIEDPFGFVSQGGHVDPGLLFSRPQSSSMELATFDPMSQDTSMASFTQPDPSLIPPRIPTEAELRRSNSTKKPIKGKKVDRRTASSPIKPSGRPGLSRSVSENRGRGPLDRTSTLPPLVPASRPVVHQGGPAGVRSASQGSRPTGRISPFKSQHNRLSSLTSIPESNGPRTVTSVKFTIDSRGRARAETTTTVVDDEEPTPTAVRRRQASIHRSSRSDRSRSWESSDDDASSTDDEPIIIPSRNTSFALPDPQKPSMAGSLHSSRRSVSDRSVSTLEGYAGDAGEAGQSQHDGDSEAETVMNEGATHGDAASELRRVVEKRQKRASLLQIQPFPSGAPYHANIISPTTASDASHPTPSTATRGTNVRCICNNIDGPAGGDGFMVQCESCEHWLHGKCIRINRRNMTSVYICAFCANTPNARTGRIREAPRAIPGSSRRSATSPLAHKSFKSFR